MKRTWSLSTKYGILVRKHNNKPEDFPQDPFVTTHSPLVYLSFPISLILNIPILILPILNLKTNQFVSGQKISLLYHIKENYITIQTLTALHFLGILLHIFHEFHLVMPIRIWALYSNPGISNNTAKVRNINQMSFSSYETVEHLHLQSTPLKQLSKHIAPSQPPSIQAGFCPQLSSPALLPSPDSSSNELVGHCVS